MDNNDITKTGALTWNQLRALNNNYSDDPIIYDDDELQQDYQYDYRSDDNQFRRDRISNIVSNIDSTPNLPDEYQAKDYSEFAEATGLGKSKYDKNLYLPETMEDVQQGRAQQQKGLEKIAHGVGKGAILAATTAADGLAGTAYGVLNLAYQAATGNIHSFSDALNATINNDLSIFLQGINERSEQWMPNYYSQEELAKPWYEKIFTANFIGDGLLKNSGFFAGAALSGRGTAALLSKTAKVKNARNIFKGMTSEMGLTGKSEKEILEAFMTGDKILDQKIVTEELAKAAKRVKSANNFVKRGAAIGGSIGESRFEAINNSTEYFDNIKRELDLEKQRQVDSIWEDIYRENPKLFEQTILNNQDNDGFTSGYTDEQRDALRSLYNEKLDRINNNYNNALRELTRQRVDYANTTFGLNMLVLSASNLGVFGDAMVGGYSGARKALSVIKKDGKYAASKAARAAEYAKAAIGPISEMEEENFQTSIQQAMDKWQGSKFDTFYGSGVSGSNLKDTQTWISNLLESVVHVHTDPEEWEGGFQGLLTALLPIPSGGRRVRVQNQDGTFSMKRQKLQAGGEFWESLRGARQEYKRADAVAAALNDYIDSKRGTEQLLGLMRADYFQDSMDIAASEGDKKAYKDAQLDKIINTVLTFNEVGQLDVLRDLIDEAYTINDIEEFKAQGIIKKGSAIPGGEQKEEDESIFDGRSDEDITASVQKTGNKIKDIINQVEQLSADLDVLYGGETTSAFKQEMIRSIIATDDRENRIKSITESILNVLNSNIQALQQNPNIDIDFIKNELNSIKDLSTFISDPKQLEAYDKILTETRHNKAKRISELQGQIDAFRMERFPQIQKVGNLSMRYKRITEKIEKLQAIQGDPSDKKYQVRQNRITKLQLQQQELWDLLQQARGTLVSTQAMLSEIKQLFTHEVNSAIPLVRFGSQAGTINSFLLPPTANADDRIVQDEQKRQYIDIQGAIDDLLPLLVEREVLIHNLNKLQNDPAILNNRLSKQLDDAYTAFVDGKVTRAYNALQQSVENSIGKPEEYFSIVQPIDVLGQFMSDDGDINFKSLARVANEAGDIKNSEKLLLIDSLIDKVISKPLDLFKENSDNILYGDAVRRNIINSMLKADSSQSAEALVKQYLQSIDPNKESAWTKDILDFFKGNSATNHRKQSNNSQEDSEDQEDQESATQNSSSTVELTDKNVEFAEKPWEQIEREVGGKTAKQLDDYTKQYDLQSDDGVFSVPIHEYNDDSVFDNSELSELDSWEEVIEVMLKDGTFIPALRQVWENYRKQLDLAEQSGAAPAESSADDQEEPYNGETIEEIPESTVAPNEQQQISNDEVSLVDGASVGFIDQQQQPLPDDVEGAHIVQAKKVPLGNANKNASKRSKTEDALSVGRTHTPYNVDKLKLQNGAILVPNDKGWAAHLLRDVLKADEFISNGELARLQQQWAKEHPEQPLLPIHLIQVKANEGLTEEYWKENYPNTWERTQNANQAANFEHANTVFAAVELPKDFSQYGTPTVVYRGPNQGTTMQILGVVDTSNNPKLGEHTLLEEVRSRCSDVRNPDTNRQSRYADSGLTTRLEWIFSGRLVKGTEESDKPKERNLRELVPQGQEDQVQIVVITGDGKVRPVGENIFAKDRVVALNPYRRQGQTELGNSKVDNAGTVWIQTKEADGRVYFKGVKVRRFDQTWQDTSADGNLNPLAAKIKQQCEAIVTAPSVAEAKTAVVGLMKLIYITTNIGGKPTGKGIYITKGLTSIRVGGTKIDLTDGRDDHAQQLYDALKNNRDGYLFQIGVDVNQTKQELLDSNVLVTDLYQLHNANASLLISKVVVDEEGAIASRESKQIKKWREDLPFMIHTGLSQYDSSRAVSTVRSVYGASGTTSKYRLVDAKQKKVQKLVDGEWQPVVGREAFYVRQYFNIFVFDTAYKSESDSSKDHLFMIQETQDADKVTKHRVDIFRVEDANGNDVWIGSDGKVYEDVGLSQTAIDALPQYKQNNEQLRKVREKIAKEIQYRMNSGKQQVKMSARPGQHSLGASQSQPPVTKPASPDSSQQTPQLSTVRPAAVSDLQKNLIERCRQKYSGRGAELMDFMKTLCSKIKESTNPKIRECLNSNGISIDYIKLQQALTPQQVENLLQCDKEGIEKALNC